MLHKGLWQQEASPTNHALALQRKTNYPFLAKIIPDEIELARATIVHFQRGCDLPCLEALMAWRGGDEGEDFPSIHLRTTTPQGIERTDPLKGQCVREFVENLPPGTRVQNIIVRQGGDQPKVFIYPYPGKLP